jgi:hypothetical protein
MSSMCNGSLQFNFDHLQSALEKRKVLSSSHSSKASNKNTDTARCRQQQIKCGPAYLFLVASLSIIKVFTGRKLFIVDIYIVGRCAFLECVFILNRAKNLIEARLIFSIYEIRFCARHTEKPQYTTRSHNEKSAKLLSSDINLPAAFNLRCNVSESAGREMRRPRSNYLRWCIVAAGNWTNFCTDAFPTK